MPRDQAGRKMGITSVLRPEYQPGRAQLEEATGMS